MGSVKEASEFLAPVLSREQLQITTEKSLVLRLSKPLTSSTDKQVATPLVVYHALDLLLKIHWEICQRDLQPVELRLESPAERRTIYALLDLLILEAVYPSLSHGVGIPVDRRARSFVLPNKLTKPQNSSKVGAVEENRDAELLRKVVEGLISVINTPDGRPAVRDAAAAGVLLPRGYLGIGGMIRDRCLVDLIAGCGELAFNPGEDSGAGEWKVKFSRLIEGIPTGALLPLLLSLLHPLSPPWFRQPVSRYLSRLPISRPRGVQSILELFLSAASSGNVANAASAQLSVDALSKASMLISSVPTSMSAKSYFTQVCPQLLETLRSSDPGLESAAAYVIAELLGKKGKEVEGTIEDEIVWSIIAKFDPPTAARPAAPATSAPSSNRAGKSKSSSSALLAFENELPRRSALFEIPDETESGGRASEAHENASQSPLVSESDLSVASRYLEVLMASHPTPLVPQRLVSPILIPLWGLMSYAKSTGRSAWHARIAAILKSYLAVAFDQVALQRIQADLMFTGGESWEYAPGSSGGIEIRSKTASTKSGLHMDLINSRVEEFLGVLKDESVRPSVQSEFFLGIFRAWLARGEHEEPVKMLIKVKILQGMLETHGESLAKKPTEILQVIKGVLDEHVEHLEARKHPQMAEGGGMPSLDTLGKIVQEVPNSFPQHNDGEEEVSDEAQRAETVAMALSLLSVLMSSPETKLTPTDERLVTTLHPALQYLSTTKNTDATLVSLAKNITSLLSLHIPASTSSVPTPVAEMQREKYTTALSYLRDPLIPVRAHGLHLLGELILDRAPVVGVTNTARLLIALLKDGDSFVYLNVVKCLTALTDRHSNTVTKMLVEAYVNDEDVLGEGGTGLGLDERLRIGEALLSTVQRLNKMLVGEVAGVVAEGMVRMVSRRKIVDHNPQPDDKKGGEDEDGDEDGDGDGDEDEDAIDIDPETGDRLTEREIEERRVHSDIVKSWASTPHEDLRLRASALSILGAAVQTNPSGLSPRYLREAIDVSLAVLTQETAGASAILRRAAVICVDSVLKAVVRRGDDDKEGGVWRADVWAVVKERVNDLKRVLGYVRVTDMDGLVREQAGVVEENLMAVTERRILGGRAAIPLVEEDQGVGVKGLGRGIRML